MSQDVPALSEFPDIVFEHKTYPCYGVKFPPNKDEIHITADKKIIAKFKKSDFNEKVDFTNIDTISNLIKVLRVLGVEEFSKRFSVVEIVKKKVDAPAVVEAVEDSNI